MISKFTNDKKHNVFMVTLLTILTIMLNSENSIYIQNLFRFVDYFNVTKADAEYIVRFAFIGTILLSLVIGPLADSYGRRRVLIIGVLVYLISNILCVSTKDFDLFLSFRFFDGLGRSVPLVVAWLIVFDKIATEKAAKEVSFVQGIASSITVFIPALNYEIGSHEGWRLSLYLPIILAVISMFLIFYGVEETLPNDKRKEFKFKPILKNYWSLIKNKDFMIYVIIYAFASLNYNVFFTNASLMMLGEMNFNKEMYSFYQTLNNIIFIVFSFISIKLIAQKGFDFTKNTGLFLYVLGCCVLFIVTLSNDQNIEGMFIAILITAAGASMMNGFMLRAIALVPDMRGTAMTLNSTIVLTISARGNFWSQKFFNGTMLPPVIIIFICAMIATLLFCYMHFKEKKA